MPSEFATKSAETSHFSKRQSSNLQLDAAAQGISTIAAALYFCGTFHLHCIQ